MQGRPTKNREIITLDLLPTDLKAWRERLNYSQRDAAHALGCSRGAWSNWENGASEVPKYIGLAMAALALGIDPYGGSTQR